MKDIGKNIRTLRVEKGLTQEALADALFITRQTVSNYETGRSRPDINMLMEIAAVLGTDANHILYGPPIPASRKRAYRELIIGCIVLLILTIMSVVLHQITKEMSRLSYFSAPNYLVDLTIDPALMLVLGWCILHGVGLLFGAKPFGKSWTKYVRYGLLISLGVSFLLLCPLLLWLVSVIVHTISGNTLEAGFTYVPVFQEILNAIIRIGMKYSGVYCALGGMLWIFGFPERKNKEDKTAQEDEKGNNSSADLAK